MNRPYRKYAIPPRDAIVTTGEMIEFRPEDDRTGNALAHPPLTEYVWGRPVPPEGNPVPPADEADKPAAP